MPQLLAHLWGDYLLQSDWMAKHKTKRSGPALVHALLYSLCFVPLCWRCMPAYSLDHGMTSQTMFPDIPAWLVIFGTHFLIDRFRLVRYVVWLKNWLGPWHEKYWIREIGEWHNVKTQWPLKDCPTGYPPETPVWLATWLLIIADNTLHLTINYLALRWL